VREKEKERGEKLETGRETGGNSDGKRVEHKDR
jgi:hypothetical protein